MDSFFASVEALEDPSLRNRPLIVGGDGTRGVVASCSYEARAYGIRSAMPSSRAKRLCPHAKFVNGRYHLYEKYSRQMHEVFARFTPLIEGLSLDEAFLDVTGSQRLFGTPTEIGWAIRDALFEDLGLHASVGVASTKHVAKLASVAAKPKATKGGPVGALGVLTVPADQALDFLHPLPVRAIWGVGPKAGDKLATIGIFTVGELANADIDRLRKALGVASAEHLYALAWNRDDREVVVERGAKSVGHEQTYATDLSTREQVHRQFVRLADAVSTRLRKQGQAGRTITIRIRYASFETITRSKTLPKPTANAQTMVEVAEAVTATLDFSVGIRLAGISVSNLAPYEETGQLSLGADPAEQDDDEPDPRRNQLDQAIDVIRARYGDTAVVPGQLVEADGPRVLRRGQQQWGPTQQSSE